MTLPILIWILVFVVSLIVLLKASDYFTDSAAKIGIKLGIPEFIVGLTIVAIGTSLPELVASIVAVLRQSSEIVAGNVIGSNIANVFLILGIAAIISKRIRVHYDLIHVDLPLFVGSAFLLAITIWDGVFTLAEGLIALAGVVLYLAFTVSEVGQTEQVNDKKETKKQRLKKGKFESKAFIILVISAVFIYFGAHYTIESVLKISVILDIGKEIISISAVALGTSLPELLVCIKCARKGKPEMAVGNVLGSNIFNTFAVMGVPALLGNITVPDNLLMFGLPVMIIATLLFLFITQDKQITKWEGWLLVIFYVLFIGKISNLF